MAAATVESAPPSLVATTIRRSVVVGRIYLVIGTATCFFFVVLLGFSTNDTTAPLLLPVFAATGGLGGVLVFTNDRVKGVYEYLIAYGVSPRRLFANVLVACLAMVSIIFVIAIGVGVSLLFVAGAPISRMFLETIVLYSVPMGFATVLFAATVGMFWSSLSSPRAGMNSPLGLVPMIGILPPLVTLIAAEAAAGTDYFLVTESAVVIVIVLVLGLVSMVGRLMPNERLLSPA